MRKYAGLFFLTMFLIGTDTFLISPLLPTLAHLYGIRRQYLVGWSVPMPVSPDLWPDCRWT